MAAVHAATTSHPLDVHPRPPRATCAACASQYDGSASPMSCSAPLPLIGNQTPPRKAKSASEPPITGPIEYAATRWPIATPITASVEAVHMTVRAGDQEVEDEREAE